MIELKVNAQTFQVDVDPDTPLLWVLREELGLQGTKYSCGIGECGACMVHVNGEATRSCVTPVSEVTEKEITTIEGLAGSIATALREAWVEGDVPQCGYCQPGQIMKAAELLASNPQPSDSDIDAAMSQVLCRCGTYNEIRRAIHQAARRTRT
ncbi:(2Fe-2S)-binding protein [Desulfomonile tiedjei]|uniref:Aerobic-type carbon monoxide dehydrogenase, small subunit CoxS/CutS-like protein n=1 Tax=Desulfomonile tiedjei (strain ATCC 49306 / DSM 6799 / DCB-1) TaxID=706587 RepID=I4C573_DESTA|nr:(2Fe-2S)-binding protein [Desulfomonile tiedjei]AFM24714.1 aerobic-type carbon monoxide dehydrogenase, small subunit CoxS/CutS-like protein [Desulfomonile tiedjei DSM 6799]